MSNKSWLRKKDKAKKKKERKKEPGRQTDTQIIPSLQTQLSGQETEQAAVHPCLLQGNYPAPSPSLNTHRPAFSFVMNHVFVD